MLKRSLAAAAIFTAVAANAAEPVVVPHYTLNTSTEAANGTLVVTPRGYVVASLPGDAPEVSTCPDNTREFLEIATSLAETLNVMQMTGAADSRESQTFLNDLDSLAGGMKFTFDQCQKSAQPVSEDKVQRTGEALDALRSKLNKLRKPAL